MKSWVFTCMRWLAISSLFLLTACSGGDLSVKTDLDETYSVKESAVSVEEIDDWSQHRDEIAGRARGLERLKRSYDNLIDAYKNAKSFDKALNLLRSDKYKEVALSPVISENEWLNKYPDVEIPYVQIKFRAIFEDLNGSKEPTSYKKLTCYSPSTKSILFKTDIRDTSLAFWQLALKVCNKYAGLGDVKSLSIVDY